VIVGTILTFVGLILAFVCSSFNCY